MGHSNRKDGDLLTKPWFWMVCFAATAALIILIIFMVRFLDREEQPQATTTPSTSIPTSVEVIEDLPPTMQDGLLVKEHASYSGPFWEDGMDQAVENVMAIVVENQSGRDLQLARIYFEYENFSAVFHITNLPAGESAMVLEQNAHKTVDEVYKSSRTEDLVYFQEPMSLKTDMFEYSLSDGSIQVTNKSDTDISGEIYIYYKNYSDGVYQGGITYRAKIEGGLKAGESKTVSPGHYTIEGSQMLAIQYAG